MKKRNVYPPLILGCLLAVALLSLTGASGALPPVWTGLATSALVSAAALALGAWSCGRRRE